jgi:O-antigen ligase
VQRSDTNELTWGRDLRDLCEAANAAVAIGLVGVFSAAEWVVSSVDRWVLVLLASKPLLDLTWRWSAIEVLDQRINPQAVVGVLVLVLSAGRFLKSRRDLVPSRILILFLGVALFSVLISPSSWAFNELIRLYAGACFFFIAGLVIKDQSTFDKFAKWFLVAVTVPVVLSFFQFAGVLPYEYWDWIGDEYTGRVSGTYPHPGGLIFFLICAIPIACYLLGREQRRSSKALLIAFLLLSLVALYFTYHRAGLVVVLAEIVIWFSFGRRRLKWLVLGGILLVLLAMAASQRLGVLYEPVLDLLSGKQSVASFEFLRGRGLNFYIFIYSLFSSNPVMWIIGKGGSVAQGFVPGFGYWWSDEPHNDFLRLLHAYGFLGLGLYLAFLTRAWRQASKLRKQATDNFSRSVGAIAYPIFFAIFALSWTTQPMRFPTPAWYFFAFASIVEVSCRRLIQETRPAVAKRSGLKPPFPL